MPSEDAATMERMLEVLTRIERRLDDFSRIAEQHQALMPSLSGDIRQIRDSVDTIANVAARKLMDGG